MPETDDKYPECEKVKSVQPKSQAIGEFLDWLGEKGIHLAKWGDDDKLWPFNKNKEELLAEYFEIDLNKVEQEKRQMLEEIRNSNV